MRMLFLPFFALALALPATGFKTAGRGENRPSVQSAFGGAYYVRAVPADDFGNRGTTRVFRVGKERDELLDEYPVFMRGELHLGWSPSAGKWCLVQVEPERITGNDDQGKLGKLSRLTFHMGGKLLNAYSGADLRKLGLIRKVQTLVHSQPGQFLVRGIRQVPRTNRYVFVIETVRERSRDPERLEADITTGEIIQTRK